MQGKYEMKSDELPGPGQYDHHAQQQMGSTTGGKFNSSKRETTE